MTVDYCVPACVETQTGSSAVCIKMERCTQAGDLMEDGRVVLREKQSFSNRPDKFRSHSKRVPNLLAGAPLLPGPITPNYVPLTSPELSRSNESFQPFSGLPPFMLAPSVLTEGTAGTVGVGHPNSVCFGYSGYSRVHSISRRNGQNVRLNSKREKQSEVTRHLEMENERVILLDSKQEFPEIGEDSAPSQGPAARLSGGKFPSKSKQLKKQSLKY